MAGSGSTSGSVHLILFSVKLVVLSLSKLYKARNDTAINKKKCTKFYLDCKIVKNLFCKKMKILTKYILLSWGNTHVLCNKNVSSVTVCLIFATLGTPYPIRSTETKPTCVSNHANFIKIHLYVYVSLFYCISTKSI